LSSTFNSISTGVYTTKSPQIQFNFGATCYFEVTISKTRIKLNLEGIVGKFLLVDSNIRYSKYVWNDLGFDFS